MVKIMRIDLKAEKVMTSVTLTFDLEPPKTIGLFLDIRAISGDNFRMIGAGFFELS